MTTDIETTAVSGEIVNTAEGSAEVKRALLKENEGVIRRNWKALEEKGANVYRALTIIHSYNLWKLHTDAKGKRKYSNFETYLKEEFGWTLTRVRALQVIKATRSQMIEAGELPASTAVSRTRSAPEVTSERAAKVTADQLQRALDAFATRVDSIDEGDPDKASVVHVYEDVRTALSDAIDNLRGIAAAAETSNTDEDEDDEDDEDEDDAS